MERTRYTFDYTDEEYKRIINGDILNPRGCEREILDLLIAGHTCHEIGRELGYSYRTIQRRRQSIYLKVDRFLSEDKVSIKKKTQLNSSYSVYVLVFPNHKIYVGQSRDPVARWHGGNGYVNNAAMHKDIKKYGWDNILKVIPYTNLTHSMSLKKEKELILLYKSYIKKYGYNAKV